MCDLVEDVKNALEPERYRRSIPGLVLVGPAMVVGTMAPSIGMTTHLFAYGPRQCVRSTRGELWRFRVGGGREERYAGPWWQEGSPLAERLCVIIPAFNEEATIGHVVGRVREALPQAVPLVVSDGSTDDTAQKARSAGAQVIELPFNLGIGGAVQAGYRYALRHGFSIAMQVDGDGQHDPAEAEALLAVLRSGQADLVVGSRWLGRGQYRAPLGRRFGMQLLARLVRWRIGQRLTDTTSGFRAANRRAIRLFAERYPVDFPEVESLVLAARQGLRIAEVPVAMQPRQAGSSSIAGLRSAYYMARVCLGLAVDALRGGAA